MSLATTRRKKILVLDDEETIVLALARALYQDNDDTDVLLAGTGEVAQAILLEQSIDVLVTDMRLPQMSGTDLLCWAATHSPSTRAIVMTAFGEEDTEDRAYALGCLHFVRKPFDLADMRRRVRALLEAPPDMVGNLGTLHTVELLQMVCLGRKTAALRVHKDAEMGIIHVRDGEVIHAVWGDLTGEEAFRHLIGLPGGGFTLLPAFESARVTIERSWQHLLMDCMRMEDEAKNSLPPRPTVDPTEDIDGDWAEPPPVDPSARTPQDEYARLKQQGLTLMKAGDLAGARESWERARVLANSLAPAAAEEPPPRAPPKWGRRKST